MFAWFNCLFGKHELVCCNGVASVNEADHCGRCDRPFTSASGCQRCRHCQLALTLSLQPTAESTAVREALPVTAEPV